MFGNVQVPRNRYWGLHPPPAPLENVIDDGLTAIQRAVFLKKAGVESAVDDEFLLNPPSRVDLLESAIENMIRCFCISVGSHLMLITCNIFFLNRKEGQSSFYACLNNVCFLGVLHDPPLDLANFHCPTATNLLQIFASLS